MRKPSSLIGMLCGILSSIVGTRGASGMPDIKPEFWANVNATTTSLSSSASSTSVTTILFKVDPGPIVPLRDDGFKKLLADSNEANSAFEGAKSAFQKEHGIAWEPQLKFTSAKMTEDSQKLLALRNEAMRLLAKLLATPRK